MVAFVIDLIVELLAWIVVTLLLARILEGADSDLAAAVVVVAIVFVFLGYPIAFETLWRGRTLGKAAMGLRVVRDDGGPIRFRHALVRGLVGVVVDRPGLSAGLLALVPMLTTKRSKRLGDLAAGTVVVQDRVPSRVPPAPVVAPELGGWAAGLDLSGVHDQLALEIRHFLGRAQQLTPAVRAEMGNGLLAQLNALVGPLPAGMEPWTYLQTVLAERSRRETARLSDTAASTTPAQLDRPPPPPGSFAPPA